MLLRRDSCQMGAFVITPRKFLLEQKAQGPTRGASFVTEHNPKNGNVRQWMESYDQAGSVNRVHPKINLLNLEVFVFKFGI